MFDIGWTELLVIGVVALIVVGPKDLPEMFRTLGRFTAKARSMAREFSRAMEDAADESGVGDVAKDLKNMTSAKNLGLDSIKDAATRFEGWDPTKKAATGKKGPATAVLSEERAQAAKKLRKATAKKASDKLAKETKAAETAAKPAKSKPASKKPAAKSTKKPSAKPKVVPTKKTASKAGSPAKKPAVRKTLKKTAKKVPTKGAAK